MAASGRFIVVKPIKDLQESLGYQFQNEDLLLQALTHSSAINEKHPSAFKRDYKTLALVGDAILKYVVARYFFDDERHGRQGSVKILHDQTQTIIPNEVLAGLAKRKLTLEKYLVRGSSHRTLVDSMYASCLEAIFGAIALDCQPNRYEEGFNVIRKVFVERNKSDMEAQWILKSSGSINTENESWIVVNPDNIDTDALKSWSSLKPQFDRMDEYHRHKTDVSPRGRSCCSKLFTVIFWIFALIGVVAVLQWISILLQTPKPVVQPGKRYEF